MIRLKKSRLVLVIYIVIFILSPSISTAQGEFNPHLIISDQELQSTANWSTNDIQNFLQGKGSYLSTYKCEDVSSTIKSAAEIIKDAANNYQINPKYILVNLQKEQSLVTDDTPTQKQLDWAAGYGVCDSCSMSDPKIQKYKGFGKQVDNTAGIMRWYYDNKDQSYIKKKDQTINIDGEPITPQSWATAFLYTYTPHLHGNKNFWKIWQTWFSQIYPNGTLAKSSADNSIWLIQNGTKRKFKNQSVLITRADPNMIISIAETELSNYTTGPEISFPNYSLLRSPTATYLLDYDYLRPFASDEVIRQLGYNPQEIIDVNDADLVGLSIGKTITSDTLSPVGVIYQITDLNNAYYLFKDNLLTPIIDVGMIKTNYKNLSIEKHKLVDIKNYAVADLPANFNDGTLLRIKDTTSIFVMENGKKRRVADEDTFLALGYKTENLIDISVLIAANIIEGEEVALNSSLLSSKDKYLGDTSQTIIDQYGKAKSAAYLVAEYPSGRIISGKNIDKKRPIASLTKVITAFESLNQGLNLAKTTTYSSQKYASSGKILNIKNNYNINNKDLLLSTLVGSHNNLSIALALATEQTEKNILKNINKRIDSWDANNTQINDLTGLSEKNLSTPRDLLKIYTKILKNDTIKSALGKTSHAFSVMLGKSSLKYTVNNTNELTTKNQPTYKIIASKTGYTEEAGAVMFMLIESKITKKQYSIIILGNPNYGKRFNEPNEIAKWISTGKVKIVNND